MQRLLHSPPGSVASYTIDYWMKRDRAEGYTFGRILTARRPRDSHAPNSRQVSSSLFASAGPAVPAAE
jgi:hypothetical protein